MFRCPQECGDWLAQTDSAGDSVKLTVLDLKLKEVTFLADPDSPVNYYSVAPDTTTGTYPTPHWLDANGDGDVLDANDHQSPVCYKRNTKMAASVKVGVSPSQYFTGTVKIRGDGPGNLDFPETVATVANGEATITQVKCANPFPDCVTCYVLPDTSLAITWEISRDAGASWITIPTQSKNEAFIILDAPQAPQAVPWNSVLQKATYWAAGDSSAGTAVDDLTVRTYNQLGKDYDGRDSHCSGTTCNLSGILADNWVDCRDVSAYVHILTCAIGVATEVRIIDGPFYYKPIDPIGSPGWAAGAWNFHQVLHYGNVYDACLRLKQSDPRIPRNEDVNGVYRTDLFDTGSWSPDTPFAYSTVF
jgi:hypothetical protein